MSVIGISNGKSKKIELVKGISAWTYGYDGEKAYQIRKFNKKAHATLKFKYLFPYAGSLEFNAKNHTAKLWYKPKGAGYKFAKKLPKVYMMPIIDARADKKEFNGWTDEEYKRVAKQVADAIIKDRYAIGVQIDIEPFQPDHLPFYKYLKDFLNKHGKYCTMFTGPKRTNLMKQIFNSCNIVILSGYDLNGDGTPLEKYKKLFKSAVAKIDKLAKETNGRYMVGIPASASWGEWEYTVNAGGKDRKESGCKQEDYIKACLNILKKYKKSPEYIGVSLWQLKVGKKDEPKKVKKKTKFPNYIRPSIWKLLENY